MGSLNKNENDRFRKYLKTYMENEISKEFLHIEMRKGERVFDF